MRHTRRMSRDHRGPEGYTYSQGKLEVAGQPPEARKRQEGVPLLGVRESAIQHRETIHIYCVKPPSLWHFATAAPGDEYSMVQFLLFCRVLRMIKCQHVVICSKYLQWGESVKRKSQNISFLFFYRATKMQEIATFFPVLNF